MVMSPSLSVEGGEPCKELKMDLSETTVLVNHLSPMSFIPFFLDGSWGEREKRICLANSKVICLTLMVRIPGCCSRGSHSVGLK